MLSHWLCRIANCSDHPTHNKTSPHYLSSCTAHANKWQELFSFMFFSPLISQVPSFQHLTTHIIIISMQNALTCLVSSLLDLLRSACVLSPTTTLLQAYNLTSNKPYTWWLVVRLIALEKKIRRISDNLPTCPFLQMRSGTQERSGNRNITKQKRLTMNLKEIQNKENKFNTILAQTLICSSQQHISPLFLTSSSPELSPESQVDL